MKPRASTEHAAHAIAFGASVVRAAIEEPLPKGTVLNVNMPATGSDGYEWTTLGRRHYHDDVDERKDPRGRPYYWVGGGPVGHDDIPGSDCVAVERGHNSLTPMHLDLNDRARIQAPPWQLAGFRVVVSQP
jgi:5'-nucleotidase